MADTITQVDRYSIEIADQVGEGARVLGALSSAGANLIALWGYPTAPGAARVDLVAEDAAKLKEAAKMSKIKLGKKMPAFLVQGKDKIGVIGAYMSKLAEAGINVYAAQAVCTGKQYGAVICTDPKDAKKAAKVLAG